MRSPALPRLVSCCGADATRGHRQFAGAVADRRLPAHAKPQGATDRTTLTNNCSIMKPGTLADRKYSQSPRPGAARSARPGAARSARPGAAKSGLRVRNLDRQFMRVDRGHGVDRDQRGPPTGRVHPAKNSGDCGRRLSAGQGRLAGSGRPGDQHHLPVRRIHERAQRSRSGTLNAAQTARQIALTSSALGECLRDGAPAEALAEHVVLGDTLRIRSAELLIHPPPELGEPHGRQVTLAVRFDDRGLASGRGRSTMACTGIEFCKLAIVETKQRARDLYKRPGQAAGPTSIRRSRSTSTAARTHVPDSSLPTSA